MRLWVFVHYTEIIVFSWLFVHQLKFYQLFTYHWFFSLLLSPFWICYCWGFQSLHILSNICFFDSRHLNGCLCLWLSISGINPYIFILSTDVSGLFCHLLLFSISYAYFLPPSFPGLLFAESTEFLFHFIPLKTWKL